MKKREDQAFLEWIKRQPSCISGQFSEYHDDGNAYCIPAHVRRAGNAGTAYKPLYSAVPLTDTEHKLTHQHGESYFHPKEWWDEQAAKYLERWSRINSEVDAPE